MLWHFRLSHLNFQYMKHLFPYLFFIIDVFTLSCDICIRAKQHQISFPSQAYKPTHPFTLVHSDVLGPFKITTSSGKRWLVTFIDDYIHLIWVLLVSNKSEVTFIFRDLYNTIEMQFNVNISILQSGNGREFQNHTLNVFLSSKGIVHQSSCAYTLQQNRVVKHKTVTFWKLIILLYCLLFFLPISRAMLFSLQSILSTECLLVSYISRPP